LNAILNPGKTIEENQRPPVPLVFCEPGSETEGQVEPTGMQSLASMVGSKDAGLRVLLQDWLTGVYILNESTDPQSERNRLNPGEMLVNKHGDVFTRYS